MDYTKEELLKNSWFNCYKNGVNKQLERIIEYINKERLKQKKKENISLIEIFLKEAERIAEEYCDKSVLFLLTCTEGVLISKYYFSRENKAEINFEKGAYFTEESCGTNAISLAMEIKDLVSLRGYEHYCSCFYNWNCMAVPITIEEKIIGYLDMSLLNRKILEKDLILFELLLSRLVAKMTVSMFCLNEKKLILDKLAEEILILSAKGYTIKEISTILNISKSSVKYHRSKICQLLEAKNLYHAITKAIKYKCFDLKRIY